MQGKATSTRAAFEQPAFIFIFPPTFLVISCGAVVAHNQGDPAPASSFTHCELLWAKHVGGWQQPQAQGRRAASDRRGGEGAPRGAGLQIILTSWISHFISIFGL